MTQRYRERDPPVALRAARSLMARRGIAHRTGPPYAGAIRTKRIIGVFGGETKESRRCNVLESAEAFGRIIAAKGHITMTGGTDAEPDTSLPCTGVPKSVALRGASGYPWIGVAPDEPPIPEIDERSRAVPNGMTCVVYTSMGNRRNYLEACLCDAAIVVEGGNGTVSEAASCLALGRPIVFIGDYWREKFNLDSNRAAVIEDMVDRTFRRLKLDKTQPDPDFAFTFESLQRHIDFARRYSYATLATDDQRQDVFADLVSLIPDDGFPLNYPSVAGLAQAKAKYAAWVEQYGG